MAPPELARDAPVADVVHPLEVGLRSSSPGRTRSRRLDRGDGLLGERLRFDEPLRGDERLDDGLAALALAEAERVVLDLDEQAERFEIGDDALAGLEAVEPGVGAGGGGHAARRRRSPGSSADCGACRLRNRWDRARA